MLLLLIVVVAFAYTGINDRFLSVKVGGKNRLQRFINLEIPVLA